MTCREKLAIEHPDKIDPECRGGCVGCPSTYGYLHNPDYCDYPENYLCTKCWDQEIPTDPGTQNPCHVVATIKPQIDISALVNEAIEKKDRTVHILIMGDNISVDVRPLEESDPRWIMHEENRTRHVIKYQFECSECRTYSQNPTPYCPFCGEKLRMPVIEDKRVEDVSEDSVEEGMEDVDG